MVKSPNLVRFILNALLILILLLIGYEWINTLPNISDTSDKNLWMFTVPLEVLWAICLIIPWKWLRYFVSISFLVFWYQYSLWGGDFFRKEWIIDTWLQLENDIGAILRLDWMDVDEYLRTGIFYLLMLVVVSLLHLQVVERRKALFIIFVTIVYFSVLDTFFLFEGKYPVIKSFVYGFLILAIINIHRIEGLIKKRLELRNLIPWFGAVLTIILVFTTIGFYSPKAAPQWPDPVAFIQAMKEGAGSGDGGSSRSGYGADDSRLGGSFIQSDDVVLVGEVHAEKYPSHYWRGEAKEIYTGHGWVSAEQQEYPLNLEKGIPDELYPLLSSSQKEQALLFEDGQHKVLTERITFYKKYETIFTSGQPDKIVPRTFSPKNDKGPLRFSILLDSYLIKSTYPLIESVHQSLIPTISEKKLLEVSEDLKNGRISYPGDLYVKYTQLPVTLPDRVTVLANEITADEPNLFRKVKAVENYLRWGFYTYETIDVPVPREDQDFVDQFLFETRKGYCDHFSSAMVVMLRTQGIPARWVKGFTFGELKAEKFNLHKVTVREKNAHSWVEVYFPGVGWVPFEPTASFTNPYEIIKEESNSQATPNNGVSVEKLQQLFEQAKQQVEAEETFARQSEEKDEKPYVLIWVITGVILSLGGLMTYFFRDRFWLAVKARRITKEADASLVVKAYQILILWLEKLFFPRREDKTIREYTSAIGLEEGNQELLKVTRIFEETRYGEKPLSLTKEEFIRLWKGLMNKLTQEKENK